MTITSYLRCLLTELQPLNNNSECKIILIITPTSAPEAKIASDIPLLHAVTPQCNGKRTEACNKNTIMQPYSTQTAPENTYTILGKIFLQLFWDMYFTKKPNIHCPGPSGIGQYNDHDDDANLFTFQIVYSHRTMENIPISSIGKLCEWKIHHPCKHKPGIIISYHFQFINS